MKEVINKLKKQELVSSKCAEVLEQSFTGVPLSLMKRMNNNKHRGSQYSSDLRAFSLTLQFYSTKAYNFVRKSFQLALPHPSQVRRWYSKVTADPGFTEPSFQILGKKVAEAANHGEKVICSLMLDEMAIKKHVSWDGSKYRGYVDVGNGVEDDDSNPLAKDVLVFMVVSVNSSWKIPIAYFFIDGLSGAERANIVMVAVRKLSDIGVEVFFFSCF